MSKDILKAIEVLRSGGIVIFPTDTAFGIGCRIDDRKTVERLFKIRKRPKTKAVPVLFSTIDMVREYVKKIPQDAEELMRKYWPGALTLILQCNKTRVPSLVRGGGETLGVRVPNHKIIREIISKVGVPILGPSANFSGGKTPFMFEDLDPEFVDSADYVLNLKLSGGKDVSTVIDCAVKPWEVVRKGAVHIMSS
ncbi:MAG: threonylcarbamoyl-AMP synthase [Candidatus Levybacteria bacterium]|nr:threonylcarbamoyl-AMP synthase [Candidatus Levybacteria bacterium]